MPLLRFLTIAALWAGGAALAQSLPQSLPPGPLFMGFYESWKELPGGSPRITRLAQMPGGIDLVAIGFVKPDLTFDGTHLASTGIQTPFDAPMLAQSIAALKAKNPKTKVLLSVGGSGYNGSWPNFSPEPVARLVKMLGADGVDIDLEPARPDCSQIKLNDGVTFHCASEILWQRAIKGMREQLPRPYILSVQGWSVGAYGAGKFADDLPFSAWTGSMLWLGRMPEAKEIDVVAVMAYDAGPTLDPQRVFAAYRAIWPGHLLLGLNVPEPPSKEAPFTVARLKKLAAAQRQEQQGGIMLYAVTDDIVDGLSMNKPDGALAAQAICEGLGRSGCD